MQRKALSKGRQFGVEAMHGKTCYLNTPVLRGRQASLGEKAAWDDERPHVRRELKLQTSELGGEGFALHTPPGAAQQVRARALLAMS